MPRPSRCRKIRFDPHCTYFKPRGVPVVDLCEVELKLDEMESLRLADLEGLYHEEAAKKMNVSRQTFDRILTNARKVISDAIINGKAISIKGGNIMPVGKKTFDCHACKHSWSTSYGSGRPDTCPKCGSGNLHRSTSDKGQGRRQREKGGRCRRAGNSE